MKDPKDEYEVFNLKRDLIHLDPNDEDARIDLNIRLVARYPFLEMKGWDESKHSDFRSTWLDQMPIGWKKTLGIPLCEELREELLRIDPSLLNTYRVSQVKEKYGTLRWYDSGSYSEEMDDILTKYEDISKYTCTVCGKLNVPVFDDGWISPFCTECYKEHFEKTEGKKATDRNIKQYMIEEPGLTKDTIITIYNSKGKTEKRIDFSDTLRNLGVDPDNLPTIEEIIKKRESEEDG